MHRIPLIYLFLVCSCASCPPPRELTISTPSTRTPAQQTQAAVFVGLGCLDIPSNTPRTSGGSGVIVGPHEILTAVHVIQCQSNSDKKAVVVGTVDGKFHVGVVDLTLPLSDVARIWVKDDLAAFFSPVSLGPKPQVGDVVFEAAMNPRQTYRWFMAQARGLPGDLGNLRLDGFVEFGNSGSGLYDRLGRLVGIVIARDDCQRQDVFDHGEKIGEAAWPCQGFVSTLGSRRYLLE